MDPRRLCNGTSPKPPMEYCIFAMQPNNMVVCYTQMLSKSKGLWLAESANSLSVPTFLLQLTIIICVTRLLTVAFRAMHLPRIAAQILGGVLLGPGGLFHLKFVTENVYPFRSLITLETFGNLSLLYHMFIVGMGVDLNPIMKAPKKAFSTAIAGFVIPFPVGYALHYLMVRDFNTVTEGYPTRHGPLIWGIALSTTNFPELAQILSDLKLLHSEVGRTALSAAVISEFFSWILLVLSVAVVNNGRVYTIVFSVAFVAFSLLLIRPALRWAVDITAAEVEASGGYTDAHVSLVLVLVVMFGYITDACGCHSILGGFMLGLIMPKGALKEKLTEKVEGFVSRLMMPMFFALVGIRTNHLKLSRGQYGIGVIAVAVNVAFLAKILSTLVNAVLVNKMKPKDGLALGFLMNTKGMLALIVISSARDLKVLNNDTFTVIITALWLMTVAVGPILRLTYKSSKRAGEATTLTITSLGPHSEFRILTCFHASREVTGVVNLLAASNPTRDSPISISAIHLVENVGHASAMLIVHDACNTGGDEKDQLELTAATAAFKALKAGREVSTISVEMLSIVSDYVSMHEDITSLASEKNASLLILPYHVKRNVDGSIEDATLDPLRGVNKSVMESAQCSVAVLVNCGHHRRPSALNSHYRHFFLLFIGGPDDREALAYAGRMSSSPGLSLTVTRYIEDGANIESAEKAIDDRSVEEFLHKTKAKESVTFNEKTVLNTEAIVKAINTTEDGGFDLIIVGRGKGRELEVKDDAEDWSELPELGLLGDTLVGSSFAATAWVLVVQQGGRNADWSTKLLAN